MRAIYAIAIASSLAACGPKSSTPPSSPPADDTPVAVGGEDGLPPDPAAERPSYTAEQCEAEGGTVVGDIGDGAVHRPDYRCENGDEPVARVDSGIEGAVCCPG